MLKVLADAGLSGRRGLEVVKMTKRTTRNWLIGSILAMVPAAILPLAKRPLLRREC